MPTKRTVTEFCTPEECPIMSAGPKCVALSPLLSPHTERVPRRIDTNTSGKTASSTRSRRNSMRPPTSMPS